MKPLLFIFPYPRAVSVLLQGPGRLHKSRHNSWITQNKVLILEEQLTNRAKYNQPDNKQTGLNILRLII